MRKAIKLFGILLFSAISLLFFVGVGGIITGGDASFTGVVRFYNNVYDNIGFDRKLISETTADLALYVATTGSDSNTCLTAPTACLTVQAAVNKVPKSIKHRVTINIGAGNFAAFIVSGFQLNSWTSSSAATDYQFQIVGADPINYTPVGGGTGSGTATGGTTATLIDAGQGWAVNALRGKLVFVNSSWLIIRKNDATSLETVGVSSSTMSGKAYIIQDWSTIINTSNALKITPAVYASVAVLANTNVRDINNSVSLQKMKVIPSDHSPAYGVFADESDIDLQYIYADQTLLGIYLARVTTATLANIVSTGGTYGFYFLGVNDIPSATTNLFAYANSTGGYYILYGNDHTFNYVYTDANVGAFSSFAAYYVKYLKIASLYGASNTGFAFTCSGIYNCSIIAGTLDSNGYGVGVGITAIPSTAQSLYGGTGFYAESLVISNSTNSAVYTASNAIVRLYTVTGTGNGGYGINSRFGSKVYFYSGTTVTGIGDIKLGSSIYTYAGDYGADGNYKEDASDGTIIKRVDALTF